ncbi:MAG: copper amine oxidase N-terminal domain-containing protein, partial [Defluviitaleaceae bacterium]|nr:copper amine oxidase N-terminal domain-containing protein [Defluviitaleaceae bacterium]
MFKERLKGFAAGVLVTVLFSGTLMVSANTSSVIREVFYGVNIVINGNQWNPPADMTPFIADGRTFLSVRGIAQALDVPVDWDGSTRTVYIGHIPGGQPFWSAVPAHEGRFNRVPAGSTVAGVPFDNAVFTAITGGGGVFSRASQHNLNAQYSTFNATIGRLDGSWDNPGTISFFGDGRELASFPVGVNELPRDISIDVAGVILFKIEISANVSPWPGTG